MQPTAGNVIANRFQLIREVGRGNMGSVWLAHHLTLEVGCAVKFIAGEALSDPKYLAQFHVEARTIAQIQSPHVVRVLDHDVCGDVPYIAMELLEGEDLRTRLHRERSLDPLSTHKIVSEIARGLSRAHAAGVVHRDLKPENVFLADEDGETVVKLLDFGVAKWASLLAPSGTPTDGLVGTPEYMSPEQACGMSTIDHRADLWALAVIAFECLTGRLPFEAPTMSGLLGRITAGLPLLPSEVAPDVPPEVDGWWLRAVSRSIDGRYQSARELSLAFGRALGLAEVSASTTLPPRELASFPPVEQVPSEASLPALPDRSRARRWRRMGYPAAAAGLLAVLALPFAERAYGHGAPSDISAPAAPRAAEVTGQAPRAKLARLEVDAQPTAAKPGQQRARTPARPAWRSSAAPAPRASGSSHARPSLRDDPDGVLGI